MGDGKYRLVTDPSEGPKLFQIDTRVTSRGETAVLLTGIDCAERVVCHEAVSFDLADPIAVEAGIGSAVERSGGLDILVNNVGAIVWKRLGELTPEDWKTCLEGTLLATLHASQAALPALRASGRGRIVNILDADADTTDPVPFATAYKIGKRGTFTLTKTMAALEAEHGVTVNAVSPGTLQDSDKKPDLERIPAGRYGTYADVANAVLHLASDAAAYVTGTQVKVSGGYLI